MEWLTQLWDLVWAFGWLGGWPPALLGVYMLLEGKVVAPRKYWIGWFFILVGIVWMVVGKAMAPTI